MKAYKYYIVKDYDTKLYLSQSMGNLKWTDIFGLANRYFEKSKEDIIFDEDELKKLKLRRLEIIEIFEVEEVEIKGEDFVETKFATGNYILIWDNKFNPPYGWQLSTSKKLISHNQTKLIHNKHKDILEAYLKNPYVEIEIGVFTSVTGETEPSKWELLKKDFIEDYNEEFWYRLKEKDLAWYEDKNMVGKMIYDGLNKEYGLVLNIKDTLIETSLDRKYSFNEIGLYKLRPATESEVLSLIYKPQQKVSKEKISAESNRLKDLFLNNRAECLVENEQEFRLIYDFLDKTCDKSLNRYLKLDGSFDFTQYNNKFPICITAYNEWGNIYEWYRLEDRDKNKPLIKFNGE